MKTLSIRQPWAHLIVSGIKIVENRTWYTSVRGPILIHAGKTIDQNGVDWCIKNGYTLPQKLLTGGVVGCAEIVGIVRYDINSKDIVAETVPGFDIMAIEDQIVKWFSPGGYGFVLYNAKPSPFFPCRGKLGFFNS